jgi:hypothetical protein
MEDTIGSDFDWSGLLGDGSSVPDSSFNPSAINPPTNGQVSPYPDGTIPAPTNGQVNPYPDGTTDNSWQGNMAGINPPSGNTIGQQSQQKQSGIAGQNGQNQLSQIQQTPQINYGLNPMQGVQIGSQITPKMNYSGSNSSC